MVMGLGLLFLGMEQMSAATSPLRTYEPFIEIMSRIDNPLPGIALGAVFTALVQSSSATTGIVIMLASQGFLSLEGGIALAIGANVGTCFTAILSALGKPPEAVRAAVVHVLFNLIGALLWVGLIDQLADVARVLSPASAGLEGADRLASETPRQIANANSLFNAVNTIVLIWFTSPIAKLAEKLVPDRPTLEAAKVEPKFLDQVYLRTPSIAVDRVKMELVHMGGHVLRMLEATPAAWESGSREQLNAVTEMDDDVDRLHRAILAYVRDLGRLELKQSDTERLEGLIGVANYLESIGDIVGSDLVRQGTRRLDRRVEFEANDGSDLWALVVRSLRDSLQALEDGDVEAARAVVGRKREVHGMVDDELNRLGRGVGEERIDLERFRIGADVVGQVKRLFYNVRKIAQIIVASAAAVEGTAPGQAGDESPAV